MGSRDGTCRRVQSLEEVAVVRRLPVLETVIFRRPLGPRQDSQVWRNSRRSGLNWSIGTTDGTPRNPPFFVMLFWVLILPYSSSKSL